MTFKEKEYYLRGKKIGVVFGNRSIENILYIKDAPDSERGIISIEKCLRDLDFDYIMIDTTKSDFIEKIKKCDVIFVYMQGEYGEDGRIQGLMDYLNKPYTGSGVLPNAIGLNKVIFKHLISNIGIKTPNFIEWNNDKSNEENLKELSLKCKAPYMLKPTYGGSSIGIIKCYSQAEILKYINNPNRLYDKYFIEEFIEGTMITSGVFDYNHTLLALPLLEVCAKSEFYDEKTKLNKDNDSDVEFVIPARLSENITSHIMEASITMFKRLNYKGFARFDYIIDKKGNFYCLEVNSIPGLSDNSNFTKSCNHIGIQYKDIIVNLLWNAIENVS